MHGSPTSTAGHPPRLRCDEPQAVLSRSDAAALQAQEGTRSRQRHASSSSKKIWSLGHGVTLMVLRRGRGARSSLASRLPVSPLTSGRAGLQPRSIWESSSRTSPRALVERRRRGDKGCRLVADRGLGARGWLRRRLPRRPQAGADLRRDSRPGRAASRKNLLADVRAGDPLPVDGTSSTSSRPTRQMKLSSTSRTWSTSSPRRRRKTELRVPLKYRFSRCLRHVFSVPQRPFSGARSSHRTVQKSSPLRKVAHGWTCQGAALAAIAHAHGPRLPRRSRAVSSHRNRGSRRAAPWPSAPARARPSQRSTISRRCDRTTVPPGTEAPRARRQRRGDAG